MAVWRWGSAVWGRDYWGFEPTPPPVITTITGSTRWHVYIRTTVDLTDDNPYNFMPRLPSGKLKLEWMNQHSEAIQAPATPEFMRLDVGKFDINRLGALYGEGYTDWTEITDDVLNWSMSFGSVNSFRLAAGDVRLRNDLTKWIPGVSGSYDLDGRMYVAFAFEKDDTLHYFTTMVGNIEPGGHISLFGFYQHLENTPCNPFVRLDYTWEQILRQAMGATIRVSYDTSAVKLFNPELDDAETFIADLGVPYISSIERGRPPLFPGSGYPYEYNAPNINSTVLNALQSISQLQAGHACEGPNGQIMHQSVWDLGINSKETTRVVAGDDGVIINALDPVYRNRYTIFTYLPPDAGVAIQNEYSHTDIERLRTWGAKRISIPSWLGNDPLDGLERYAFYTDPGYYRMWKVEMQKTPVEAIMAFMRYPLTIEGDFYWGDNQTYNATPVTMKLSSHGPFVSSIMNVAENIEGELFVLDVSKFDEALIG